MLEINQIKVRNLGTFELNLMPLRRILRWF